MLFAEVVAVSAAISATRSRTAKTQALADLLRRAGDQVGPVTAWLAGEPQQGRIGIGWRRLTAQTTPPAREASLVVEDVDRALTELADTTGIGSTKRRAARLGDLFAAATEAEQRFLLRLFTGEMRQGALESAVLDPIAVAADVSPTSVRRAFMLSGNLPITASLR